MVLMRQLVLLLVLISIIMDPETECGPGRFGLANPGHPPKFLEGTFKIVKDIAKKKVYEFTVVKLQFSLQKKNYSKFQFS